MKKTFVLALASLFMLASCSKEINKESAPVSSKSFFKANVEETVTKGVFDGSGNYSWTNEDKIGVVIFSENEGYNDWAAPYKYSSMNDRFEYDKDTALGDDLHYGKFAFFPYGTDTGVNGETNYNAAEEKLYVHLFSEREYSADVNWLPLAANITETDPSSITLKHIAAGIRINLENVPFEATKVTLSVAGQDITGWYTMDRANVGSSAIVEKTEESTDRGNAVSYTLSKPKSSLSLTFPVPVLTTPILTIDVYAGSLKIFSKTSKAQPSLTKGQILNMPLIDAAASGTKRITVGVINYLINDLGDTGYQIHYWNASTSGDVNLVGSGNTESKAVGYWNNEAQAFHMYSALIPADCTGFKVHRENRWFGDDGTMDKSKAYIFNYDDDKALYE